MTNLSKIVKKRHQLIPGAAHTYSKGDDQFPSNAPKVIVRGKGAYVWDDTGRKYLDWTMGLRSVGLGHAYDAVNRAVSQQIKKGNNFGRPSNLELEVADLLVKTLPNAEMVKFAKNGSTVTTAAVKLARAYTGRKYVALCKDHPFFSYDDWFIGTTAANSGVPEEIIRLSLTFSYNNLESLEKLFKKYPKQIACVIMEPIVSAPPQNNFLQKVQKLCKKEGAVFILDEMRTGFRWDLRGTQDTFKVQPDLTTYGKAMANGYSLAALVGKQKIMELGGIYHSKPRVFLISTTHGAENIALAACAATMKEMKRKKVQNHYHKMGVLLQKGMESIVQKHGLRDVIKILGYPADLSLDFKDRDGVSSMELRTIFLQEFIGRGMLFQGYFAVSFSHKESEIKKTLQAFEHATARVKRARGDGNYKKFYTGPHVKPVFRKFN